MITHDTPNSSNIDQLRYDDQRGQMYIKFKNGRTYKYNDVPYDVWNQFISAPSIGKFFYSTIKDVYKGVQV